VCLFVSAQAWWGLCNSSVRHGGQEINCMKESKVKHRRNLSLDIKPRGPILKGLFRTEDCVQTLRSAV
jgi:hypothetical protein